MRITVNGEDHTVEAPSGPTLLDVLRDDLHLTGTKYGCGEGQCGACTVLVDGAPTRACTQEAAGVAGAPRTGGLCTGPGPAVRLLHTGHGDVGGGTA